MIRLLVHIIFPTLAHAIVLRGSAMFSFITHPKAASTFLVTKEIEATAHALRVKSRHRSRVQVAWVQVA